MTLLQGEDYYRTLVELAPDVIYTLDRNGCFTDLSPAFEEISGWSVDGWIGRSFSELIHPEDLSVAVGVFAQSLRGEIPPPHELRIRSRAGGYLTGEFRCIPRVDNGLVTGAIGVARDMTARKQIEDELKRSRDQLEIILESVDDGITAQAPDGRVVYANAAAARLVGFASVADLLAASPDEMARRFQLFDEDAQPLPYEQLPGRRVLHGEDTPETLIRFRPSDGGEDHWSVVKASPVRDELGNVRLVINVFQDVTERRRAEMAQRRLASIVESSDDAIIGKDLDSTITNWNPGAERLYGYRAEEVIGRSIALLAPPERPDELPDIMARLRRGEIIDQLETVRVCKDGRRVDVWLSISPIRDERGVIVGASTIARDITEQKRTERERDRLLAAEREARARAESAQERLSFLARASEILSGSLDYETTLANVARIAVPYLGDWCTIDIVDDGGGYRRIALTHPDPEKEVLARELEERYPPQRSPNQNAWDVIGSGRPYLVSEITDEMLARTARDENHLKILRGLGLISFLIVPLVARDRVLGAISLVSAESGRHFGEHDLELGEDLAHRAAVAVDNARLYKEAQDALRLREEFLSIASHELKTPLTSLQLQIQLLDRLRRQHGAQTLNPERIDSVLEGTERQIKRLARLINDLLDVSRIASGRLELEMGRLELAMLVQEVVERFRMEAYAMGSSIQLEVDQNPHIDGDAFRLDQVITNLLSNAIKYGDGKPIEVVVGEEDGAGCVAVTDHGIGIPAGELPRVFDRFERVVSAHSYGGLGLGLFIARQIVDAHGGFISVESEEGTGSTFTISLPLSDPGRDPVAGR